MAQIICGDALDEMRKLPDSSCDLAIIDPPYAYRIRIRHHKRGSKYCEVESEGFLATAQEHLERFKAGEEGEPYVLVGNRSLNGVWHAQGKLFKSREEAKACRQAIRNGVRKHIKRNRVLMCIMPYYEHKQ